MQTPVKIIDSHLHLFNLAEGDYGWLKPHNPPHWPDKASIHRDFSEQDIALSDARLAGFVHIEAGFDNAEPWRELAWLSQNCHLPFKAVACADITDVAFSDVLARCRAYACFIGVRHILDEQAVQILSQPQSLSNLSLLQQQGGLFEAQLSLLDDEGCALLCTLAQRLPELTVVINHAGFAPQHNAGATAAWRQWLENLSRLAACENIMIKCSGLEMGDREWKQQQAEAVLSACLSAFGDSRVMLASNFPLCLLSLPYASFWQRMLCLAESTQALDAITHDNAQRIYGF